jgi:hypothetical protein
MCGSLAFGILCYGSGLSVRVAGKVTAGEFESTVETVIRCAEFALYLYFYFMPLFSVSRNSNAVTDTFILSTQSSLILSLRPLRGPRACREEYGDATAGRRLSPMPDSMRVVAFSDSHAERSTGVHNDNPDRLGSLLNTRRSGPSTHDIRGCSGHACHRELLADVSPEAGFRPAAAIFSQAISGRRSRRGSAKQMLVDVYERTMLNILAGPVCQSANNAIDALPITDADTSRGLS